MTAARPARATGAIAADTAVIRALRRIRVPQTQRNRELFLLVFAFVINAVGDRARAARRARRDRLRRSSFYCGGLTALVIALHIVLRLRARAADPFVAADRHPPDRASASR